MQELVLNIGEVKASREAQVISCYGLGSCVGVFLYDRRSKIAGGAHILLPDAGNSNSTEYAEQAFKVLLNEMKALGSDLSTLRAKIIGGGNMFSSGIHIGLRNINSVKKLLLKNKIYLASDDTGGNTYRSGKFYVTDGSLEVSSAQSKYKI